MTQRDVALGLFGLLVSALLLGGCQRQSAQEKAEELGTIKPVQQVAPQPEEMKENPQAYMEKKAKDAFGDRKPGEPVTCP